MAAGVDFHADPTIPVKHQVRGNRFLYMFDKYYANKYKIPANIWGDRLFT